jgi:glycosyltransferase involved in cell wall biosynthesis
MMHLSEMDRKTGESVGPFSATRARHVAIVTPVLDDWKSFAKLLGKISDQFSDGTVAFHIVAVDDGSATPLDSEALALSFSSCIVELNVMVLALNLGHQRAIAAGLCALVERTDIDAVIVMDSDGEDRPEDVATLLAASRTHPAEIVLARRTERSETRIFKIGYLAYRLLFRLLTGRAVAFGNFSLIPFTSLQRLVRLPELWNNLAAALMRSRMPYITVATRRGVRYFGQSRMNLTALVIHGLSAVSVYVDVVFIRILIAAAVISGASLLAMAVVVVVRFMTDLAIPGWATIAAGDLAIVLFQTIVLVVATTLMMLSNRSSLPIVPARDYSSFVLRMIEVKQLAVSAEARRDDL